MHAMTARRSLAALLVTVALAVSTTGCAFSTAGAPPTAQVSESAAAAEVPADLTLATIFEKLTAAGITVGGTTSQLDVEGFATDGLGWVDDTGNYFLDVYWVDTATAPADVLANLDLARTDGYVDLKSYTIPVDDVRGTFMVNLSGSKDPAAALAAWKDATSGK